MQHLEEIVTLFKNTPSKIISDAVSNITLRSITRITSLLSEDCSSRKLMLTGGFALVGIAIITHSLKGSAKEIPNKSDNCEDR